MLASQGGKRIGRGLDILQIFVLKDLLTKVSA